MTIKQWLDLAYIACDTQNKERLSAQVILEHAIGKSRVFLHGYPETLLTKAEIEKADKLLNRRLYGEPLAYILGVKEFYGLDFKVNSHTLIPRPETELIIDTMLLWFQSQNKTEKPLYFIDIGTGSGCIGITLAHFLPTLKGICLDISSETLLIAKENAQLHGVEEKLEFVCYDIAEYNSPYLFDFIVSNPPYIEAEEYALLEDTVKNYEPPKALTCMENGLEVIKQTLTFATKFLKPMGVILLEHGYNQGKSTQDIAKEFLCFHDIKTIKDYSEKERFLWAIKNP